MQHVADSTSHRQPSTRPLVSSNLVVSALVILTLMSGWAIFLYLGIGSLITPTPQPTPNVTKQDRDDQMTDSDNEAVTSVVSYPDEEQTFVLKLQLNELQARVQQTRSSLEQAQFAADQFQDRIEALKSNDTGRRLATPDTARKIQFLTGFVKRIKFAETEHLLSEGDRLINSLRQPHLGFDQFVEELIEAETKLQSIAQRCVTANQAVDQLLDDHVAIQPNTLREAIEQQQQSDLLAITSLVNARLVDERKVQSARMASEKKRLSTLEKELQQAKRRYDAMRRQSGSRIEDTQRSMLNSEATTETRMRLP